MACVERKKARKGVRLQYRIANGFYAPSYPTTIAYPTLERQNPLGLKNCSNSLFLFKDADLIGCKIIAIDGTKSRAQQ
jgi:hypothetical protein